MVVAEASVLEEIAGGMADGQGDGASAGPGVGSRARPEKASKGANGRMAKSSKSEPKRSAADSKKKRGGKSSTSFLDDNPLLRNTLMQIEKEFGEGSIMPLDSDAQVPIEGISSGSLSVDLALGGKGFPRGRII